MTTYYIDATLGNDSNAGTSPGAGNAWQNLSKIDPTSLTAGDKVLLKRGETWTCSGVNFIECVGKNGAAGNPIIIGAYGSGDLPVVNGNSAVNNCVKVNACTYITIQDIVTKNATFDNVYIMAGGGSDTTNITCKRCASISPGRDGFSAESNLSGVKLNAVEFWDCVATLSGRANFFCYNWQASTLGCTFYRCRASYCGQASDSHNFSCYQSLNINWNSCESSYASHSPTVEDATSAHPGGDLYPSGGEGMGFAFDDGSTGTMKYCYSHHNRYGVQASHFGSNNVIAYNLIVHNRYGIVVNGSSPGSSNTLIYGNTIAYNWGAPNAGGVWAWVTCTGLQVINNIIAYNGSYAFFFDPGVTSPVVDYNLTFGNLVGVSGGSGAPTPTHAVTTDPKFNSPWDVRLLKGSGAIDAGTNLGVTYQGALHPDSRWGPQIWTGPFAVSVRNQSGTWDIGAYPYDAGDNMPDAYDIRVRETTTTTGTGTLTLAGAVAGHQPISVLGADGTTALFMLEDANGTAWEYFRGTLGGTGTTVARTLTIRSTNGNAAISLTTGTHRIFNIAPGAP